MLSLRDNGSTAVEVALKMAFRRRLLSQHGRDFLSPGFKSGAPSEEEYAHSLSIFSPLPLHFLSISLSISLF